jgi:hypothetical protein
MKIIEALELEMKAIQTRDKDIFEYVRDDVTQIIIGIRFKDGKYHWLLPNKDTTEKMALELSNVSRESNRWETRVMAKEGYVTADKNRYFTSFMKTLRRKIGF